QHKGQLGARDERVSGRDGPDDHERQPRGHHVGSQPDGSASGCRNAQLEGPPTAHREEHGYFSVVPCSVNERAGGPSTSPSRKGWGRVKGSTSARLWARHAAASRERLGAQLATAPTRGAESSLHRATASDTVDRGEDPQRTTRRTPWTCGAIRAASMTLGNGGESMTTRS